MSGTRKGAPPAKSLSGSDGSDCLPRSMTQADPRAKASSSCSSRFSVTRRPASRVGRTSRWPRSAVGFLLQLEPDAIALAPGDRRGGGADGSGVRHPRSLRRATFPERCAGPTRMLGQSRWEGSRLLPHQARPQLLSGSGRAVRVAVREAAPSWPANRRVGRGRWSLAGARLFELGAAEPPVLVASAVREVAIPAQPYET